MTLASAGYSLGLWSGHGLGINPSGATRQADHAFAALEPRGTAGRLGSVSVGSREPEWSADRPSRGSHASNNLAALSLQLSPTGGRPIRICECCGPGPGAGAERISSLRELGCTRQADHAVAEHEPRGAAGRLGSVNATVRGRERARSGFQPSWSPGAQSKPTAPLQSMSLAARRADSDK